ncbi:MAG: succinate dehydrogenase iron-sulfur subunit [Deferribacterota bacterium]|nr:succinate dehydrogenase iron-sulfur subunit [Deferribacterota bacterium]
MAEIVTLNIQRFTPETDKKPYIKKYEISYKEGMTILDALIKVKEEIDGSLSFRASCRMGICGSCAMLVNGFPHLACHTQVKELNTFTFVIKPLPNFDIVKDLIVDLTPLFDRHEKILPGIMHKKQVNKDTPFLQSHEELNRYLQFSYCVKCGICLSACPTCATDKNFLGPQATTQAYRYSVDTRDEGLMERRQKVDNKHGIWHCHFAGACSIACPKGVDPALAIQRFKKLIISTYFKASKVKKATTYGPIDYTIKPKGEVPKAPERTVK